MQPLAEANAAKAEPTHISTCRFQLPVSLPASYMGVAAIPRYSQGISPVQTYQVITAAITRVSMPVMVPSGIARPGERTSSADWQVPSMPR